MTTEYRVQIHYRDNWRQYGGTFYTDLNKAQQVLQDGLSYDSSRQMRIVSREATDWVPVKTPVEQAIERLDKIVVEPWGTVETRIAEDICTLINHIKEAQS